MHGCVSVCVCVWWLGKLSGIFDDISQILKGWVGISQVSRVERVFTVEGTTFATTERHVRTWPLKKIK